MGIDRHTVAVAGPRSCGTNAHQVVSLETNGKIDFHTTSVTDSTTSNALLGLQSTHATIEDFPKRALPILRWGHEQGAVIGYAHSGAGMHGSKRGVCAGSLVEHARSQR